MNEETLYYYFSTHTINLSIYSRLEAGYEYTQLNEEDQSILDKYCIDYPKRSSNESPFDYATRFISRHKEELESLSLYKGAQLKSFLTLYLGYTYRWGASTMSFGKGSDKRASLITEEDLIVEMTSKDGSIKKLLDSAHGDLSSVKHFVLILMDLKILQKLENG
jgi:hypothetical protein